MDKRFWFCGGTVAMAALLLGLLVHGVLLRADYLQLAGLYRAPPDATARVAWILLAYILLGLSMTWLYREIPIGPRGPVVAGLRLGAALALASFVPWHLLAYAGQPLPLSLMLRQCLFDTAAMLLLGLLLAWLQPRRQALAEPPATPSQGPR